MDFQEKASFLYFVKVRANVSFAMLLHYGCEHSVLGAAYHGMFQVAKAPPNDRW